MSARCEHEMRDGVLTVGDLIDIDLMIEHQCRVLDDMGDTIFGRRPRGDRLSLVLRRQELKLLQQRVRNTRTERLAAGER